MVLNMDRTAQFYENVVIAATKKIYLDGGSNTYLHERAADRVELIAGGVTVWDAVPGSPGRFDFSSSFEMAVQPTKKIYLDGGGNTYWYESASDDAELVVGGSSRYRQAAGTTIFGTLPSSTTSESANVYCNPANGVINMVTSSLRYKKDVEDYALLDAYATISGLRPITYRAKGHADIPDDLDQGPNHDSKRIGFIAEEVDEVEQMLVTYRDIDGEILPDSLAYDRITAPLVKVIQDLMTRIEALEAQLDG